MNQMDMINEYIHVLKDQIVSRKVGDHYEITTPFVDMDGDCIQFYARKHEEYGETYYTFTDDGKYFEYLRTLYGDDNAGWRAFTTMFDFGGCFRDNGECVIVTCSENFPKAQEAYISAILTMIYGNAEEKE